LTAIVSLRLYVVVLTPTAASLSLEPFNACILETGTQSYRLATSKTANRPKQASR
jgi:hypothetical protein